MTILVHPDNYEYTKKLFAQLDVPLSSGDNHDVRDLRVKTAKKEKRLEEVKIKPKPYTAPENEPWKRVFIGDHPTKSNVVANICGHRVDVSRMPRSLNCKSCWGTWFGHNREFMKNVFSLLENGEHVRVETAHGRKFMKNALAFAQAMATMRDVFAQQEAERDQLEKAKQNENIEENIVDAEY